MPDISVDDALKQLDQLEPPTEDFAPPSKQVAKAKTVNAPSVREPGLAETAKQMVGDASQYLKEEGKGFVHGLGDPYYGIKQRAAHTMGGDTKAIDKEVTEREKQYQEETPHALGIGRLLGGSLPAVVTAPVSLPLAGGIGIAQALMQPITDTSKSSYTKQSIENAVVGGVAGMAPQAVGAGIKNTLRGGVRSGMIPEPLRKPVSKALGLTTPEEYAGRMQTNINEMKRAGALNPTAGQVAEGGLTYGAGASEKIKDIQTAGVTKKAEGIRDRISPIHTVKEAGDDVSTGIDTWEKNFRQQQDKMYDKFSSRLPKGTVSPMDNTTKALASMTTPSAKAQSTSAKFINKELLDIQARLQDDLATNGGKLPFEDIKQLRTRISELVNWNRPDQPISKNELIKLRSALTQDMEEMVKGSKSKTAYKLWKDANQFTAENLSLKEDILDPIRSGKTPGEVYNAVLKGSKDDSTRLEKVLGNVDKFTANRIRSTFMNEMGREGGNFDIFKFSKEWNQLEPGVKTAMFGKDKSSLRTTLDMIADTAVSTSPKLGKGTVTDIRKYTLEHGVGGELATLALAARHFGMAKLLFTGYATGFGIGRMINKPWFVNWLAKSSNRPPASLPIVLSNLVSMKHSLPPEDQKDVDEYLKNLRSLTK